MRPDESFAFDGVVVTPFLSPHRAEDTDTVGVHLRGPSRSAVYLPDADAFPDDLVARIAQVDVALVDGTFWSHDEVAHRDVGVIPHPEAKDGVVRLADAKGEVVFTHLNHTNPLAHPDASKRPAFPAGFRTAVEGETIAL
jgi:pyrroloquinoline quinone biosynthesis protein B